ncbi:MAG: sulfatase-like hydrolase/transferase [Desulfobacteraceae bacterium]|nr:sulfatase-like hydrolase/transferase [Desulfobacteraceae bacterium]
MNVIFFITDQQRADHLGCAGNPVLKTPAIDKLAGEGVRFSNAYVANPTCMPNRASIMTGQFPNTCSRSFGVNLPEELPTFPGTLREQGYATKAIGKMHLQYWAGVVDKSVQSAEFMPGWMNPQTHDRMVKDFPTPFYGFDEVDLVVGHGDSCNGHYVDWVKERAPELAPLLLELAPKILTDLYRKSPIPEEYYSTSYLTDRSVDFLERYAKGDYGERPFLLKVSYPDPHHPCTPPGKYADMYKPEDMELPPSFGDAQSVRDHPYIGPRSNDPNLGRMLFRISNEEEVRNFISHTYGMVTMIDDSVGRILSTLEKLGLDDDTLIVYTSDHGDMMGDHGMLLKGWIPYKGILHVPLIFKAPGVTKAGSVSDSLISAVDLAPTILNLCNIDEEAQPPDMQGLDYTEILKNPGQRLRDCCLIEVDETDSGLLKAIPGSGKAAGRLKYLITDRYSLTVFDGHSGYGDLFDLQEDPHELNNLWDSNPELRHEMVEKLLFEVIRQQSIYPKKHAMT